MSRLKLFSITLVILLTLNSCQSRQTIWNPVESTINEIQDALILGEITCRNLVSIYLKRIETYDKPNGINAITVINSQALEKADRLDRLLESGDSLPELFCIPIIVKEMILLTMRNNIQIGPLVFRKRFQNRRRFGDRLSVQISTNLLSFSVICFNCYF